jgi:CO/xanthine dehydrogenase FAD-binding subunit
MKPAPFAYEAPDSLDRALSLLSEDARPLAGGQSLVPMLNFRLAMPALLVDLNAIDELSYLRVEDGTLRIGALTRQATVERSDAVRRGWPLLHEAVRLIGHAAIRSRGTIGGSVAHADPAAELPAVLLALEARFVLRSAARGERRVPAAQMFHGPLTTALAPDELLTEIVVPPLSVGARTAFVEHARTHGDFATAGAAVVLVPGARAAIAMLGADTVPLRAPSAERALVEGAPPEEAAALAAAEVSDEHRRALLTAVVRVAIGCALS